MQELKPYGDLTLLNKCRDLLDTVGRDMLERIGHSYLDLLETSSAIYEVDGSYATALFTSSYCKFMDRTSRNMCATEDDKEALESGKWLCHESCWTTASRSSIETGKPYDLRPCKGGINIYAVPIKAGEKIIGSINFGYGNPPTDEKTIGELTEQFKVNRDDLLRVAGEYRPRPDYITEAAKRHLHLAAELIGEIYARKKSEESLQESERKHRAVIQTAMDGFWLMDTQGRLIDVNDAACKMAGYTRDELLSMSVPDIEAMEKQEETSQHIKKIIEVGSDRFETRHRCKDGRIIDIDVSAVFKGGQFIIFLRDITDRKIAEEKIMRYAEELKRSNEELQQFAYIAAHDLQEPLRMITSYMQLIEQRYKNKLDKDADEFIAFAVDGANRLKGMINGLLDYSRVKTHGKPFAAVNCKNVFKNTLADLQVAVEENKALITHDPLPVIVADEAQLAEVFLNLLRNAIKFRKKEEPPHIHVSGKQEGGEWVFSFKDNGIGIEPQYKDSLFIMFRRLHGRREYPGTGIGLAVCKRIVARHGGRIWVESEYGKGSAFYFTIPVKLKIE